MGKKMIRGKVWKFGDNINTGLIYPARFLVYNEPEEIAKYAMADLRPDFAKRVKPGDLMVAGRNFGCGSSREHAALTLKLVGVGAIIAESFARIFFRNAINIGLPVLECKGVSDKVKENDEIEIDLRKGKIRNLRTGEILAGSKLPNLILEIIERGGLIPYLKEGLGDCNETLYKGFS